MLNKTILMGRLTADPELRKTQNNTSVTSFTLAVNRAVGKQGEKTPADFIDILTWGGTAEFVSKWFRKGQLVAVAGRLQTRTWQDNQGNKRKAVEVVAEEVHFAEPKKDNNGGNNYASQDRGPAGVPVEYGGMEMREIADDDGELPFD